MALVSSISSMFTDNSNTSNSQRRRNNLLDVLDKTLNVYSERLNQGKIKIRSTQDLERVVRCVAILMDAESTNPQPLDSPGDTTKVSQAISPDDPDVKAVYKKLYSKLNQDNNVD